MAALPASDAANHLRSAEWDAGKCRPSVFLYADFTDFMLTLVGCVAFICSGSMMPAFMYVFGDLVNGFGDPTSQIRPFIFYVRIQGLIAIMSFIFGSVGGACMEWSAERQLRKVRCASLRAVLRQECAWFEAPLSAGVPSRISLNSQLLRDAIGLKLGQIFFFGSLFVFGNIVGFYRQWKLALVVNSVMPLIALAGYFLVRSIGRGTTQIEEAYRPAGAVAEEALGDVRTLAAFGNEEMMINRYSNSCVQCMDIGMRASIIQGTTFGFTMAILFFAYAFGFWYGGYLIAEDLEAQCWRMGRDSCFRGGDALSAFLAIVFGAFAVGQMVPNVTAVIRGRVGIQNLLQIINRKSKIDPFVDDGISGVPIQGSIRFHEVKFAFPSRPEQAVYYSMNIDIFAGQTVAIVGASGCGKSTMVKLLERFYDVNDGQIFLDNRDVKDYNVRWMRSQIALVGQEPRLLPETIRQNLLRGNPAATDAEMAEALDVACASEFISRLPDGLDTHVGESSNAKLSGGQKQRLAIARAVVRKSPVLVLDEASSSLDAVTEKALHEKLSKYLRKDRKTCIIIAHRLSTIRSADKIIVLDRPFRQGAVVAEEGTHHSLMQNTDGLYYNLVRCQALVADDNQLVTDEYPNGVVSLDSISRGLLQQQHDSATAATVATSSNWHVSGQLDALKHRPKKHLDSSGDHVGPARSESFIQLATKYSTTFSDRSSSVAKKQQHKDEVKQQLHSKHIKSTHQVTASYFKSMKRLRGDWLQITIGSIGAIINGVSFPVFAILFSKYLTVYFLLDPKELKSQSLFLSSMFIVTGAGAFAGICVQVVCYEWAGHRFLKVLRSDTFANIVHQEVAFFDNHENTIGELTDTLNRSTSLVKGWVSDNTSLMIQIVASVVAGICIAFVAEPKLAAVSLASFTVMGPAVYLQTAFYKGTGDGVDASAASLQGVVSGVLDSIQVVMAFSLEDEINAKFEEVVQREYRLGRRNGIIAGLLFGFSQLAQYGGATLTYWYAGELLEKGEIDNTEQMFMAIFALMFAALGLGQASIFGTDVAKAKIASRSVYALLERNSAIDARNESGIDLRNTLRGDLRFEDVAFRYPTRPDVAVFRNLNFAVDSGETVAIVGSSGVGKSTVIQLLERFYDVGIKIDSKTDSGIKLDGVDLRQMNLRYLRSNIGYVGQEPRLYTGTIANNIRIGRPHATLEDIVEAARVAHAHDFIMSLPDGYDSEVGKGGSLLSTGQKQRISIARAVLRRGRILLLDEANSALDSQSDKVVQVAIDELVRTSKCTTFIVAHRLSTIRGADKIIVLANDDVAAEEGGAVVAEVGDHDTLMTIPDGLYASLVQIHQAAERVAGDARVE
eukprot:Lankesteria_metandrocarpae@DN5039_c0_g1_i1.p1